MIKRLNMFVDFFTEYNRILNYSFFSIFECYLPYGIYTNIPTLSIAERSR